MNPEFRRNLWLELTLHRLIVMPAAILMVLVLIVAGSAEDASGRVAIAAAVAACALLVVFGANSAGDAIPEEVRGRTWDTQRMSAIGPWTMTWGKLFGVTAFAWYGGAICLAILLVAAPRWAHSAFEIALLIVAVAVLAQGVACLGGLMVAQKGHARRTGAAGWLLLVAFLVFGPGTAVLREVIGLEWWGRTYDPLRFTLASTAMFAAWSVFALYRALCTALQVRTTPWAFVTFALFLTVYLAGFSQEGRNAILAWGLLVPSALTYLFLFTEQTGAIVFRRIEVRLARRELRDALTETPCWLVGTALAAVFALGALLLAAPGGSPLARIAQAPLAIVFLVARDAALFLVFAFAPAPRRVEAATLFYLVLAYGAIPWLLHSGGFGAVADFVLPPVFERPVFSALVTGVQCALVCGLALWRWRRLRESMKS
jgi:hypothetical protein